MAIGAGMAIKDAMVLANKASGIVVGKLGTATVSFEELCNACSDIGRARAESSMLSDDDLAALIAKAGKQHKSVKIVYSDFTSLSADQIEKLNDIKSGCDCLIAVICGKNGGSELARAVLCNHIAVDSVGSTDVINEFLRKHAADISLHEEDVISLN